VWFAANPETTHTRGSSVYGMLKLEESRFICTLWPTDIQGILKHLQLAKIHENCESFPLE